MNIKFEILENPGGFARVLACYYSLDSSLIALVAISNQQQSPIICIQYTVVIYFLKTEGVYWNSPPATFR